VSFFTETDLGTFSMFRQTGAHKKSAATGHRTSDNSATLSGPLYGVLRHSFGAARQSVAYKYYKTSEFRKPYLKSGIAATWRTVVTLNYGKIGKFLYANVRKFMRGRTFLPNMAYSGLNPIRSTCFSGKTM